MVILKGIYTDGSTNAEGLFQIKADFSKGPVILPVSFIGYETQELLLNAPDNALTMTLRPSAVLDQVVVAGLSAWRKYWLGARNGGRAESAPGGTDYYP